jgi:hypothetical protein
MRKIVARLTAPHRHSKYCAHCRILENKEEFAKAYQMKSYDPKDIENFMVNIRKLNE